MKKNLLAIGLLSLGLVSKAQVVYVGNAATVTVTDQSLVYDGGGWQNAGTAAVKNTGDIMIVGGASDIFDVATGSDFRLALTDVNTYGQLYISGLTQGNITGLVNKDYTADFLHASDGSHQNMALPFYNYTLQNLNDNLDYAINMTNGAITMSGRYNPGTVFKWNNTAARFDHIASTAPTTAVLGKPTDYFLVPRRAAGNQNVVWNPNSGIKTFKGIPAADDANTSVSLSGASSLVSTFGPNGNAKNYYKEKYNTYLTDPFVPTGYADPSFARNMYQYGNPFLTNMDLSHIVDGTDSDGIALTNLVGVSVLKNGSITWNSTTGGASTGAFHVLTVSGNAFQAGDVNDQVIKPMEVFHIKTTGDGPNFDLKNTRHFAQAPRANTTYAVDAAKNSIKKSSAKAIIPAHELVKQVAVVAKDASGKEIGRTYYAVAPSAVTGANTINRLQASTTDQPIYTSEEALTGGADASQNYKLYINAANETNFAGKEISLNLISSDVASLSFELYEGGERVASGQNLPNGKSFYIAKNNNLTQITDNATYPVSGASTLSLYYELPQVVLATSEAVKSQTVIAKKDLDWVVRFAKNWKNATVEVYSGSGQLLSSASNISTATDYVIPMTVPNGFYLVKAINENGETVIKKIIK